MKKSKPPWHFFYTDEGWVEAGNFQEGDAIVSLAGDYGTVDSVVIVDAIQTMYDLTVEDVHTFFIGEGDWLDHLQYCWSFQRRGRDTWLVKPIAFW